MRAAIGHGACGEGDTPPSSPSLSGNRTGKRTLDTAMLSTEPTRRSMMAPVFWVTASSSERPSIMEASIKL